jgi:hypothetical protein
MSKRDYDDKDDLSDEPESTYVPLKERKRKLVKQNSFFDFLFFRF